MNKNWDSQLSSEDDSNESNENYIDVFEERDKKIRQFIELLSSDNKIFEPTVFLEKFQTYMQDNKILYSPISNYIYDNYSNYYIFETDNRIGTILSNLEKALKTLDKDFNITEENKLKLENSLFKIKDHVNLAQQQYKVLKQSDEEFQEKFSQNIDPVMRDFERSITSQLITLVAIFTAIAFMIFGGINSLESIFNGIHSSLLKTLIMTDLWGICMFNVLFVFMFCAGKISRGRDGFSSWDMISNFSTPVVFGNFVGLSLLAILLWFEYAKNIKFFKYYQFIRNPGTATIMIVFILAIIIVIAWKIYRNIFKR